MPMKPTTRDAIKRLIKEFGPMTVQELADELGKPAKTIGSCISESRRRPEKHFYVKEWRPQIGVAGLPSGVYAIGNRKDAQKPETDVKATRASYYRKHKAKIKLKRGNRAINPFTALITQVTA